MAGAVWGLPCALAAVRWTLSKRSRSEGRTQAARGSGSHGVTVTTVSTGLFLTTGYSDGTFPGAGHCMEPQTPGPICRFWQPCEAGTLISSRMRTPRHRGVRVACPASQS